jgi:hypothetical protein
VDSRKRKLADVFVSDIFHVLRVKGRAIAAFAVAALRLAGLKVVNAHSAAHDFTRAGDSDSFSYALFHIKKPFRLVGG